MNKPAPFVEKEEADHIWSGVCAQKVVPIAQAREAQRLKRKAYKLVTAYFKGGRK